MDIYILESASGQYDSYATQVVGVFSTEELAEAEKLRLEAFGSALSACLGLRYIHLGGEECEYSIFPVTVDAPEPDDDPWFWPKDQMRATVEAMMEAKALPDAVERRKAVAAVRKRTAAEIDARQAQMRAEQAESQRQRLEEAQAKAREKVK